MTCWQKGPLPAETRGRGLVLPTFAALNTHQLYGGSDYFAEFQGDHVVLPGFNHLVLQADEVAEYFVVGLSSLQN